ncbi:MAG: cytochrome c maturation protein CcmE [Deltaproteobacteria bacterium]|nr:cytochrome c maturation protein CcmE [Deltaproteobacteria bacterium]
MSKKINKSHIIGIIVIIIALAMAMYSFRSSLTNYVSVYEAKAGKNTVQVAGILVRDTAHYDTRNHHLIFTLREDGGDEMVVEYGGPRPADLEGTSKIVVIGKYNTEKQTFVAKELLLKCPTKYESRVKGS